MNNKRKKIEFQRVKENRALGINDSEELRLFLIEDFLKTEQEKTMDFLRNIGFWDDINASAVAEAKPITPTFMGVHLDYFITDAEKGFNR